MERGVFLCPFLLVLLLVILLLELRYLSCLLMHLPAFLLPFLLPPLWSRWPVSLGQRPVLPPPLPVGTRAIFSRGPALFWADPGSDQPLPLFGEKKNTDEGSKELEGANSMSCVYFLEPILSHYSSLLRHAGSVLEERGQPTSEEDSGWGCGFPSSSASPKPDSWPATTAESAGGEMGETSAGGKRGQF